MTAPLNFGDLFKTTKSALEPIPDGDYTMKVVASEHKVAQTGAPMVVATLEVLEGAHVKRKVKTNFVLSLDNQVAVAIFFRNMQGFGLTEQFFTQLGSDPNAAMNTIAGAILNRVAKVTLGTGKPWQGIVRNEVKAISPHQTSGPMAPGVTTGPPVPVPSTGATPPSPTASVTPPNPTMPVSIPISVPVSMPDPTVAPVTTPQVGDGPVIKEGPPAPPPVPAF